MSTIGKNIIAILLSQVATWAISLVVLVVAPRYMGPDGFGTLNVASGFIGFFTLVGLFGTSQFFIKQVARDHSIVGSYVFNAFVLKLVLVAVLSVVAVPTAIVIGYSGETLLLIQLGCIGMLITVLTDLLYGALVGMERIAKTTFWTVVQVYLGAILSLGVLILGGGLVAYVIALTIANTVPVIANTVMLWPHLRGARKIDFTVWKRIMLGGFPLFALIVFNQIYGNIDVPILGAISGSTPVGWYSAAYRLVGIPIFIVTAVMTAYFPSFSAHGETITPEFPRLVNRAVRLVLMVSVPATVGMVFVADDLVSWVFPPTFAESALLVQILAIHIPLAAMDTVLALALVASDRQNKYLIVSATAAVLNPLACILAIPATDRAFGNGAIGAAIVTVCTELFIMSGAVILRSRGVLDRPTVLACLRIAAASLAMVPFLFAVRELPLPIVVATGVVCYAVASVAFRLVSVADLRRAVHQVVGTVGVKRPATMDLTE